jgi:hypothetical protein
MVCPTELTKHKITQIQDDLFCSSKLFHSHTTKISALNVISYVKPHHERHYQHNTLTQTSKPHSKEDFHAQPETEKQGRERKKKGPNYKQHYWKILISDI